MKTLLSRKGMAWSCAGSSLLVTVVILLIVYAVCDLAPFGACSLAIMDAQIQYLDFFAYFKDVLGGANSIDYTFSNYLGGNAFGLYAYYLASPFSLLVVLFPKEQMPLFFDIVVLLKLSLCSATMSFYLARRFKVRSSVRLLLCVALGVAYGLSEWGLFQASNIMWLDAAYLLPVVFLGVWRGVRERRWRVLSVAIALSLMFGWYAGAMNCLFSFFWFVFEAVLAWRDGCGSARDRLLKMLKSLAGYALFALAGVALAAIYLVPMLASMVGSSRGSLDPDMLRNTAFVREIPNLVQSYTMGGTSSASTCSLYAGMLALTGLFGVFVSKRCPSRVKGILAAMVVFLLLVICWAPFAALFSLLHEVSSYHVRYSYLVIAGIVVISSFYLLSPSSGLFRKGDNVRLALAAIGFIALQMVLNYVVPAKATGHFVPTVIFEVVVVAVLAMGSCQGRRLLAAALLAVTTAVGMGMNAKTVFESARSANVEAYAAYAEQTGSIVASLKEREGTNAFRLSALSTRGGSANQDESLAFDYASISGYSSVADPDQIRLLLYLGYPTYGACMTPVQEAVLPTDALLGVRYLASETAVRGLSDDEVVARGRMSTGGGEERVISYYENPYAFPLAFTTGSNAVLMSPEYERNVFEYLNSFIEATLGVSGGIYEEVEYEIEAAGSDGASQDVVYELHAPVGDYVLYGDLTRASAGAMTVELDDGSTFGYSQWGSRGVFSIPVDPETGHATVRCHGDAIIQSGARFYAVDLVKLAEVSRVASERAAVIERFDDGDVVLQVEAQRGKKLFLSIPNDPRWHATVNGREVSIETVAECLMLIPLDEGANQVALRYDPVDCLPGVLISLCAAAMLAGIALHERRNRPCLRRWRDEG